MRNSGILLHISSLPNNYGIGKLGKEATDFIDFLKKTKCKYWQILPLSPTSYGDSPYQSYSTRAGNPYFIDFIKLCKEKLLSENDLLGYDFGNPNYVDYEKVYNHTFEILRKAFNNFNPQLEKEYFNFIDKNSDWIIDYAIFMTLKSIHKGKPWYEWEDKYKFPQSSVLDELKSTHKNDIDYWIFLQYKFYQQWFEIKEYANENGIEIIGDIPIYVALDSVEVWKTPKLFQLDEEKNPISVAGCPPDYFSPKGQLWGNPIYDWEKIKSDNFKWWIDRISFATKIYDKVRIDHFRGFESYYAIPAEDKDATNGEWQKGPDIELFNAVNKEIGRDKIIAEDLGVITKDVQKLMINAGYPGMKVLQFAFDSGNQNKYLPMNYISDNCIVYTGTHDNNTLKGWAESEPENSLSYLMEYCNIEDKNEIPDTIIKTAWASIAKTAIAPIQDFLGIGSEGRMNTPSTSCFNWQWRLLSKEITDEIAEKIHKLNYVYNRI